MKTIRVLLVVLSCLVHYLSFAQSVNVDKVFRCVDFASQYQIELVNSRNSLNLPTSICNIISDNQHDDEIVTVDYSDEVRIRIYPRNYDLVLPIKEVVYVSE